MYEEADDERHIIIVSTVHHKLQKVKQQKLPEEVGKDLETAGLGLV